MKKSIFISGGILLTLGLTAFGYKHWDNSSKEEIKCRQVVELEKLQYNNPQEKVEEVVYMDLGDRFITSISKTDLHKAKSLMDILPIYETENTTKYWNVGVAVLTENGEKVEMGESPYLNDAQIKLMQTTDYASNIHISARTNRKDPVSGKEEFYDLVYYISVRPEKPASYPEGKVGLLNYLQKNCKNRAGEIKKENLKPARLTFMVTKEGDVEMVTLRHSCGYALLDHALLDLIFEMPEKWEPAVNNKGEKVEQEMTLFFGMEGC